MFLGLTEDGQVEVQAALKEATVFWNAHEDVVLDIHFNVRALHLSLAYTHKSCFVG